MGNFKLVQERQINYEEVYEELNRKRLEDKEIEEALLNLITAERHKIKTFSNSNKIRQKHSIQKVINLFKNR